MFKKLFNTEISRIAEVAEVAADPDANPPLQAAEEAETKMQHFVYLALNFMSQ